MAESKFENEPVIKESKQERLEKFKSEFKERFIDPQIAGTIDKFHSRYESYSGLWVSGESGNFVSPYVPAFLYGEMSSAYSHGVHEDARKWLEEHDAESEWYDGGTVMVYLK